jgi:hypothetical protein
MADEQERHPDDEEIERHSLGVLPAESNAAFEQHVLICHKCQDRVAEMDADVQGMKEEAREFRVISPRSQAGSGR